MTEYTSAAYKIKVSSNSITFDDVYGNSYLFIPSGNGNKNKWFNIAKREVIGKDKSIPKGYAGIIPDAVLYHAEEVACLLAEAEDYQERLAKAEESLRQWIDFRDAWSRKGTKKHKLSLQKKEVAK